MGAHPSAPSGVDRGQALDAVIDSGDCGTEPTTVIDFSQDKPQILRRGAGATARFE